MFMFFSVIFNLLISGLQTLYFIARKMSLTIALTYFLLISTFLNPWAARNEFIALSILFILIAIAPMSWIYKLIKQHLEEKHREKLFLETLKRKKQILRNENNGQSKATIN